MVLACVAGVVSAGPIGDSPAVERAVLECGIEIVVFTDVGPDDDGGVQVWTRMHRGSMSELGNERGASLIAARAAVYGVGEYSYDEMLGFYGIDEAEASEGAGTYVTRDHLSFMLAVESQDRVGEGFEIARGLVDGFSPGDDAIDAARASVLSEIEKIETEQVSRMMYHRWLPELLDGSGYGLLAIPTRQECGDIDAEAVRRFVWRHWTPGQASVLVVGDVDAGAVIAEARRVFDGCVGRESSLMCDGEIVKPTVAGNVVALNEQRVEGSRLGLVWFGDEQENVWDEAAFEDLMVISLAGEAMRYRVNRMLRSEFDGLADAGVDVGDLMGRIGFAQIVAQFKAGAGPESWEAVLGAMEQERRRLSTDGLSDGEIEHARQWLIQQWGYEMDQWSQATTREKARTLNWMLSKGRPLIDLEEWISTAPVVLGEVDKARINRVVRGLLGGAGQDAVDPAVLVMLDSEEGVEESVVDGVLERSRLVEPGKLAGDWIEHMRGPILNRSAEGGVVDEITVHQASGVVSAVLSNGIVVHHREMVDTDQPESVLMTVRVGFDSIEEESMHGAGDVFVAAIERGLIRSRTQSELRGIMVEHGIEIDVVGGTWDVEIRVRVEGESFERASELVLALLTDLRIERGLIDEVVGEAEAGARSLGVPVGAMEMGIARALGRKFELRDSGNIGDGVGARSVHSWIYNRVQGVNIEVGIAGGIDAQRSIEACAVFLGSIRKGDADEDLILVNSDRAGGIGEVGGIGGEEIVRVHDDFGNEGVMVGFGACRVEEIEELRALTVAGMVLDERVGRLIKEAGVKARLRSGALTLDLVPGRVVMFGQVDCDPGEFDMWASVLEREMERLAVEGVGGDELELPMGRIDGWIKEGVGRLEFWSRRMARLGRFTELGGRRADVESIWSIRSSYSELDSESVSAVFQKWYTDGERFRIEQVSEER